MFGAQCGQISHPRWIAEHLHRDDCFGLRRDSLLNLVAAHIQCAGIAIDEDRCGSHMQDAVGRGDEAEGRRDDLVAGPDAQCGQAQVQAAGPRTHADAVAPPNTLGEKVFELLQSWAEAQSTAA